MKLLIDMNLSPDWVLLLHQHGYEAVHWSSIGACNAQDAEIMQWARDNDRLVFTHDLDFGTLLVHSRDRKPSVIQARTQDVSPEHLGPAVLHVLRTQRDALERGALITIDETSPACGFCRFEATNGRGAMLARGLLPSCAEWPGSCPIMADSACDAQSRRGRSPASRTHEGRSPRARARLVGR